MRRNPFKVTLLLATYLSSIPLALSTTITEMSLVELSKEGSPELDRITSVFLNTEVKDLEKREKYAPELFGKGSYSETNERPILTFFPIFSPVKQGQLGVRKKFANGFTTQGAVTTTQQSAMSPTIGKLENITTTVLSFTVQMDIWKDLFGKLSKAELENTGLEAQRAKIEREIQEKAFRVSLRRLFWSLVANEESIKISQELLKTAQRQLDDVNRRFKASVAEKDEVARYGAQVSSREGTILLLRFQRENLLKQLRLLLPSLGGGEIELGSYNIDETIKEVLVCTSIIGQVQGVPYDFTKYDEAVGLLRTVRSNSAAINSRYASPDVSLYGTVKATGVGSDSVRTNYTRGSYQDSISDIQDTNRTGYEVGVQFTIPLGDSKSSTQKSKELYDDKRLGAALSGTDAQISFTHTQLVKSINILTDIIRTEKISSQQLSTRLAGMKRKYEQARVSVGDLIQDQDAYLNSQLITIDTQLQVLNTLFDYLVVYTDTPCPINRI